MKLLLHTCCGPCFLGVWEELGTHSDIETTLYYDNPNIYPAEEYEKRRKYLKKASSSKKVSLVESEYQPSCYGELITDENNIFPDRCIYCYRLRLEHAAKYATDNGFDVISTTLFVSPYQQHEKLREVIADVSKNYEIDFYYTDWRPYFREGQNEARRLEIYRQKYCGCKYSLLEKKESKREVAD